MTRSYDSQRVPPRRYSKRRCTVPRADFVQWRCLDSTSCLSLADELSALHLIDGNRYSSTHQQRVTKELLNMHHLCDFFVKPLTVRFQCSFMEISADLESRPLYFVSHAWSTVLHHTLSMLNWHAKCHDLASDSTFYW